MWYAFGYGETIANRRIRTALRMTAPLLVLAEQYALGLEWEVT